MAETTEATETTSTSEEIPATEEVDARAGESPQATTESGHFASTLQNESYREKYARFADIDAFAEAYNQLETKLGAGERGIQPLADDATPEQVQAYRKAIHGDAYPDSDEGYQIEMPALPDDVTIPDETIQGFYKVMHQAGAPAPVVQAALNYWGMLQSQAPEMQRAEYAKIDAANDAHFKSLWGSQDQNNLRVAAEAVRRDFGDEALGLLFEVGDNGGVKPIQGNTFLYEVLYDYGMSHGHHKFVIGDGMGGFVRPEHASAEADKLSADHIAGKITDQEYDRRMSELMRVADEGNVRTWGENESIGTSVNGVDV